MIDTLKKYIRRRVLSLPVKERPVVEAYDLWADNYDHQPGNLMLDLDELVFIELLGNIELNNKTVADVGCGTGRHWSKIFSKVPASLTGFDVSPGMLQKLQEKFPGTKTYAITDNHFSSVEDNSFDVILSTLTVAHIENIEEALDAWCRILKKGGNIIITDFHPDALASGGQRTFKHQKTQIAVQNFVHPTDVIKNFLLQKGFSLIDHCEKQIDEQVMHYYLDQNAMHVYNKFKGFPIIYGMHFRRMI